MSDIHTNNETSEPSHDEVKHVGGQAVIEGVMMRAPASIVIAVRKPDDNIVIRREKLTPLKERFPPFKWPILRGIAVLIESLVWGMKALTYSANQAVEADDEEGSPKEMGGFTIAITMMVSFALGIGLFVILPERLANLVSERSIIFNAADGALRLTIFLAYILIISRSKYISRVFEYHGAEHKSIHAYEAGEELTEENALKFSPQHPRCGTAFLMTVMVVGILVFSIFGKPPSILVRIGTRLLLLPFIAGVSYEIIKLTSKKQDNRFVKLIMLPGLWLQRLTTKEPSRDQIQVALRSLKEVLAMEADGMDQR
ncbi:DUF1385 domain-containing protein [Candidatus Poribacteria bacterium]